MKIIYQIKLHYATFGILTENDIVIRSAPIAAWMNGKDIAKIKDWVKSKQGTIEEVLK